MKNIKNMSNHHLAVVECKQKAKFAGDPDDDADW